MSTLARDVPLATASTTSLRRATWALAWPVIFSFSIESFVGLCDTLMVGRLGATAVAAVGVGVQILGAVDSMLFAVGTGALAIVARHVGAADRRAAEETLRQSIVAAAALSTLAVIPVFAWAPALIGAFRVDAAVVAIGTPFVRLVVCGVPAGATLFVIVSSLRGAGDTRTPLAIGAVVGVVNVVAAYALIFGHFGLPALGVAGAALATALAFVAGATLGLVVLARQALVLRLRWRPFRLHTDVVGRVLRIGYPAAIEHLLMQVGFFLYIVFAARYGTAAVAAYFIGVRILALSFLPGFGFAAAAGAMVGQSLGAGRPRDAERSGWAALNLALWLMSAAGVAIFVAARPIARLFVDDAAVIADAVSFIRVLAVAQPLMAIDFTLGGALRGAGDTVRVMAINLGSTILVRFVGVMIVVFYFRRGLVAVWCVLASELFLRGLMIWVRFEKGRWRELEV